MKFLIKSYLRSLETVRRLKEMADDEDKALLSSMESDLRYALEWMKTGRMPGNRRGIERLAAYQKEISTDPFLMQQFYQSSNLSSYDMIEEPLKESIISDRNRKRIEDALSELTEREREVYLMSRGNGLSYSKIANMFCVSRSAVQDTIKRAEKKITKRKMKA